MGLRLPRLPDCDARQREREASFWRARFAQTGREQIETSHD